MAVKTAVDLAFDDIDVVGNPPSIKPRTGAFEVRYHDQLLYSKLNTGQFPSPAHVVELIKNHRR